MTYSELQTKVLDWLDRSDLTSAVTDFISDAEARLNRDVRVRQVSAITSLSADAETVSLPSDFRVVQSLYHDGPTYYGSIEIVDAGRLAAMKALHDDTGVPQYAAIVDDGATIAFAPEPDATYSLSLVYYRRVPALSDSATTNWFLTAHPDIYRLAAMCEAALYLKDEALYAGVEAQLEPRLEALHLSLVQQEYGGSLVRRPRKPIGG